MLSGSFPTVNDGIKKNFSSKRCNGRKRVRGEKKKENEGEGCGPVK